MYILFTTIKTEKQKHFFLLLGNTLTLNTTKTFKEIEHSKFREIEL